MTANHKRMVVWSTVAVAILLAIIVLLWPRAAAVDLINVTGGAFEVTIDNEGETRIHDVFVLSAPVAGRLQRIEAEVGDTVVAGDTVLALIEPGDPVLLDPRSEAQARAAVQAAESARQLAQAEVDKASAELEFQEQELKRAAELVVDGTISQRSLDDARRGARTARAALDTARAALQVRLFELEQAEAALLSPIATQAAAEVCECLPITAPISGRVLTIPNRSERVVTPGEALLEIGDPAGLEIVADYQSADAVQIEAGQRVRIERWGGDQPLEGRVRLVEPFGFTKVSALGIEEQRVNVVIDLLSDAAAWQGLGHGYQVETHVVVYESSDAVVVPQTALFRSGDGWALFAVLNGRAQLQPVTVGKRNGRDAEILDGVAAGATIVANPDDRIADGSAVTARL
ncbi:MAG: efflux RND transporter periplasmic adaptor subunit [Pseudomonadota bacterium]